MPTISLCCRFKAVSWSRSSGGNIALASWRNRQCGVQLHSANQPPNATLENRPEKMIAAKILHSLIHGMGVNGQKRKKKQGPVPTLEESLPKKFKAGPTTKPKKQDSSKPAVKINGKEKRESKAKVDAENVVE